VLAVPVNRTKVKMMDCGHGKGLAGWRTTERMEEG
jgi:hypothetical protein